MKVLSFLLVLTLHLHLVISNSSDLSIRTRNHFMSYSDESDNVPWLQLNSAQNVEDDYCFKQEDSFNGNNVDDEMEEELGESNLQRAWNGRVVKYKIANFPSCTDLDTKTVIQLINEAAKTWNSVENANVLLANIDDNEDDNNSENDNSSEDNNSSEKDFSNSSEEDFNNNDSEDFNNNSDDEFNNESEEMDELTIDNYTENSSEDSNDFHGVDIILSFEDCSHLKYRNRIPNDFVETFGNPQNGEECLQIYAHAHFYGDIHLNDRMTWTDRVLSERDLVTGDPISPNLYSIVLHEFGHSLGLRHTDVKEDVMNKDFGGMRKYQRLSLSEGDKSQLRDIWPVRSSCQDKSGLCFKNRDVYCNDVESRPLCPKTCGDCDECGTGLKDDYLKCNDDICNDEDHPMRPFCRKTCHLCEIDVITPKLCATLPNIAHLTTPSSFPVSVGVEVRLRCEEGYTLDGDISITCVGEDQWSWEEEEPECEEEQTGPVECKDIRPRNCAKLSKLSAKKQKRRCKKPVWQKSCPLTCNVCEG